MLCSVCKKNMAVVFINKLDKDGKSTGETTGLCIQCAKKQGIDPLANIMKDMSNMSEEDLEEMSSQFDGMFSGMSELDDIDDDDEKPSMSNFFSNMMSFGKNKKEKDDDTDNDTKKKKKKTKYLDTFGENLTEKARNNKLDKVIGREVELQRMIQILNRRSKNNPALIGEPGVGKTAIINALAIAISNGQVPGKLVNKEVYLIDMTSLVAGTQFRGQFESRVKGALANGSVQLIGATTLKEYRKYIEKDSALERRFQPVMVDEPTSEDCFNILKGIKSYYEDYHKVKIPDEALRYAVSLSQKYIHDRFLPDKAIDLLDEACARVNLEDMKIAQMEKLQKELDEAIEKENQIELELAKSENATPVDENGMSAFEKAAKIKEEKCKIKQALSSSS